MFSIFLLSLRIKNTKVSFYSRFATHSDYGFESNGTYSINVSNLDNPPVAFGLMTRESVQNAVSNGDFCPYCDGTATGEIVTKYQVGNTSVQLNGTINKKGIYYIFFVRCNRCNSYGGKKTSLILDAEFKNANTYMDCRKKNLLVIFPLFTSLFGVVLVAWLINWFMNCGAKISIHYLFTACFILCFISKVADTVSLYYEKGHHPSNGIFIFRKVFQVLFLASMFFAIIIASKGWCIIRPTIKIREVILPLIYIVLMLVFEVVILNVYSGNWDILFMILLIASLTLYVRDLIKSTNSSSMRVLAHCLSIAAKGIDPKSTPIWRKRMMLNNLRLSFCVYCVLLIIRLIFLFFLDHILWVDDFLDMLIDLVMVLILGFTFYLRKESTNGYSMIFDDGNENEYTLQDLEGVDFNSDRIQGGVTWTPDMKLPTQPIVIDTPTTVTIESPDGTTEVNVQPASIEQNQTSEN